MLMLVYVVEWLTRLELVETARKDLFSQFEYNVLVFFFFKKGAEELEREREGGRGATRFHTIKPPQSFFLFIFFHSSPLFCICKRLLWQGNPAFCQTELPRLFFPGFLPPPSAHLDLYERSRWLGISFTGC